MKKLLVIGFLFLGGFAKGQVVPLDSVRSHEGTLTTICDKVWDTFVSKTGNIYLNYGGTFLNNSFTAVIFAKDTANFKEFKPQEFLKGKKVCVTGTVTIYKDKPQIVIKNPNQIRIPDQE